MAPVPIDDDELMCSSNEFHLRIYLGSFSWSESCRHRSRAKELYAA